MAKKPDTDTLRSDYSFSILGKGARSKYLNSYQKGSNLVLLNPDIAKVFSTEEAVNDALRSLINVANKSVVIKKRVSKIKLKTF
jgi:hypothetical protein